MTFNVKTLDIFERQAKRLIKKYPSLKKELLQLIVSLKSSLKQGTAIGSDCYKIRIVIASKSKGKSGGKRIITHLIFADSVVYLINIYDKSEKENLTNKELKEILKAYFDF